MDGATLVHTLAVDADDAVRDAKACARDGVTCIGLLSGGISRGELNTDGAAPAG